MIPRVPHLKGSRPGQSDLLCDDDDERRCRETPVVIVEKLDGIAVEFVDVDGEIDVVMKADWRHALKGRVRQAVRRWASVHARRLRPLLKDGQHLYGEWLWHQLVVGYDHLPSCVVFHGIADDKGQLRSRLHTMPILRERGLAVVDPVFVGVVGDRAWSSFVPEKSAFGPAVPEGVVVEFGVGGTSKEVRWAKWVAAHYQQPTGRDLRGTLNRVTSPS